MGNWFAPIQKGLTARILIFGLGKSMFYFPSTNSKREQITRVVSRVLLPTGDRGCSSWNRQIFGIGKLE